MRPRPSEPDEGTVALGGSVKMGYFAQHAMDLLDGEQTVFESLEHSFPHAGQGSLRALASCLGGDTTEWALVGYRLRATLSSAGGVNRGVLEVSAGGRLLGIEEVLDIAATEDDAVMGLGEAGPRLLHDDALVSMNLWGFRPDIFPALAEGFERFLDHGDLLSDEYPLPVAVQDLLAVTGQQVSVLTPGSRWFGMTYAEDLPFVRAELQRLTDAGSYPSRLWA